MDNIDISNKRKLSLYCCDLSKSDQRALDKHFNSRRCKFLAYFVITLVELIHRLRPILLIEKEKNIT